MRRKDYGTSAPENFATIEATQSQFEGLFLTLGGRWQINRACHLGCGSRQRRFVLSADLHRSLGSGGPNWSEFGPLHL